MDSIFFQIQDEICIGLGKLLKVRISYWKVEIFMKMRENIPDSPRITLQSVLGNDLKWLTCRESNRRPPIRLA